jgi:hypothetical protein
MRLPESESAYVPAEKLTGYLLSESHPVGRAKAKFFRSLGYDDSNVADLESGLLEIARNGPIAETEGTPYGVKYVIDGSLKAPAGRIALVRTVWIVETGDIRPRFVTAFPQ